ncbi:peptidase U32 family protein [Melioribacteraceae bacterium 4301-Me]|uniref:peptidase U32 family protein n=1 Tax=Pyranulibacter aquaticus TaxID=3163344 RepID=UPI003596CACA
MSAKLGHKYLVFLYNMSGKVKKPELIAPAGDWTMLIAAINSGADAIYFGLDKLNMRANAKNFTLDDVHSVVSLCKEKKVKVHLALNSIVFENEIEELDKIISEAKAAGVDMIICWDTSVIMKCIEHKIPFCVSTQASVSNSLAAEFYQKLGAKRIVLARECTLDKIREIKSKVDVEIETFVHGAMCVAVSGRCFMSHEIFNKSANRGECIQPCRREYEIRDIDGGYSLLLGRDYVMSPKDLCTINFIDKLIEAKIDAFKIEGRKRSPEYISKVVSVYRQAIDLYFENKLDEKTKQNFYKELEKVYNRGFSNGFYFGEPTGSDFSTAYGSSATTRKVYIGKVLNYYKKSKIAYISLETGNIKVGSSLYIIGKTTGVVELKPNKFIKDNISVEEAMKGDKITFECEDLIRENDKVYKIVNVKENATSN